MTAKEILDVNALDESISPVGSRYGLPQMVKVFHRHATIEYILRVEAAVSKALSELHPEIVPPEAATEIAARASLEFVDPKRVAEIEAVRHHDVLSIVKAHAEACEGEAGNYIHLTMTSADATETAKALQLKEGIGILSEAVEALRSRMLDKAQEWSGAGLVSMQVTHNQDALPEAFGRPLAHYAELMGGHLDRLAYDKERCCVGKISGATGNYHPAVGLGINGPKLEAAVMEDLGISSALAASQVPGREYVSFILSDIACLSRTLANCAMWIWDLKSTAKSELYEETGKGQKGSSTMPHKTLRGGNPFLEERLDSIAITLAGTAAAALESVRMRYARDLAGSLHDRVRLGEAFVLAHYACHVLKNRLDRLQPDEEAIRRGLERTFGIVCAENVMTNLTGEGMSRDEAHGIVGEIATACYEQRRPFREALLADQRITARLSAEDIERLTRVEEYTGLSAEVIERVERSRPRD